MKRLLIVMIVAVTSCFYMGCELDGHIDIEDSAPPAEFRDVSVTPLVSGLNYPTTVRFITSDDPMGTGENAVLKKGNLLVTNTGSTGQFANSILEIDPLTQSISVFSDADSTDYNGEPAINRPVGLAFPGAYPWVANATWCYGSMSALDASPGFGYDGPQSQPGEAVNGPLDEGVYACSDFHLTVLSVTPSPNTNNVSLSSHVVVRFSQPVDPSTVTEETFELYLDDGEFPSGMGLARGPVLGTYHFSSDLRTITFVPDEPLLSSTIFEKTYYELTLDNKINDIYGRELDANLFTPNDEEEYVMLFSTEIETVPPRVVSIHPSHYQQVTKDTAIVIEFSEKIRKDSIDEHSFKLIKGDRDGYYEQEEISGDKYYYDENYILAFIPDDSDWAESSIYYIQLVGYLASGFPGVQDRAGNALDGDNDGIPGGDYWSSFFTKGFDDPPYIVSYDPPRGARDVSIMSSVRVVFSEPVYSGSITNRSFLLYWGDGQIPGIVSRSEGYIEAEFTPYEPLPYGACLDVILTAEIEDVEGNPLDGNRDGIGGDNFYSWFCTGADPDNFPPQVAAITPADGSTDWLITAPITAMFTKEIDPTTVNASSFLLNQGGTPVSGTVSVLAGNQGATFTPAAPLAFDTQYSVTITDAVMDLGGRALDGDYDNQPGVDFNSTFSTQVDPLTVPVYVIAISPMDGETDVSVDTSIVATFSRQINPATVWTGNFYMFDGGNTIPGVVTVAPDNIHATLTPSTQLAENTLYNVHILDTVQDPGGIALDGDHDGTAGGDFASTFTTEVSINLVINEFMAAPSSDWDGDGSYSSSGDEWVEIYNNSPVAVDLSGMFIGDGSDPTRFMFGTESLPAFSYRVVYGSEQGSLSLNNSGDTVYLWESDGTTLVENFTYGSASSDASIQRIPNGTGAFENSLPCSAPGGGTGCPSPGADNTAPKFNGAAKAKPGRIVMGGPPPMAAYEPYNPILVDNWGFGGVTYGGPAPDTEGENNTQYFASHPMLNDIYVFDFDTGYYNLGGDIPELVEMPGPLTYVPTLDTSGNPVPGTGSLFVLVPQWDSVALFSMEPTGPIGSEGVKTAWKTTDSLTFYPVTKNPENPYLMYPTDIVYNEDNGYIYVANRANGSVAEMDINGHVRTVYKTNLGAYTLSGVDVGDWGQGTKIVITATGGPYVLETSGPLGALYYFEP